MSLKIVKAEFIKSLTHVEQAPKPARPSIAFAGKSNVGKSSLLNCLVKRKGLAKTSSTPGRTQSIVFFDINDRYYFVDLPGYGFAKAPKKIKATWGPMVERYLSLGEGVRLVIVLLDARRIAGESDLQLIQWLEDYELPYFFALTKTDKLTKNQLAKQIRANQSALGLDDSEALLPFSAKTGEGRRELLEVCRQVLEAKG